MTSGVVTFDPNAFVAQYPVFAAFNSEFPLALQGYFNMTTPFLNNTPASKICDLITRSTLLNLLVAHLATLDGVLQPSGQGTNAQLVGRISSATEGSVTTALSMPGASANSAWFQQTQYGATFWQMTASFRTMRYVRGCRTRGSY